MSTLRFLLFLFIVFPSISFSFEYEFPVYRIVLSHNELDSTGIVYEGAERGLVFSKENVDGDIIVVSEWTPEFNDVLSMKNRFKRAGFVVEINSDFLAYDRLQEAESVSLNKYVTYTDMDEFLPDPKLVFDGDSFDNFYQTVKNEESRTDVTTDELINLLKSELPRLLASVEIIPDSHYMIGKYYYLRGLKATKVRMEKYSAAGFVRQRLLRLNSEENRSYLTAIQHFSELVNVQSSFLAESALYHVAACYYGLRNVENKTIRIGQCVEAYENYLESYPDGEFAKRAAMNIIGLQFEQFRLGVTVSIDESIVSAQSILAKHFNEFDIDYEVMRVALLLLEILNESGAKEAAFELYISLFHNLEMSRIKDDLMSTYTTALQVGSIIFKEKMMYEEAMLNYEKILEISKSSSDYLRGGFEENRQRIQLEIKRTQKLIDESS